MSGTRINQRFHGRGREIGAIRSLCDAPGASVLVVRGMRGVGKSALVARALTEFHHVMVPLPALPEPLQRRALARALDETEPSRSRPAAPPAPDEGWGDLLSRAATRARPDRAPFVLVLDDSHRLTESRARLEEPLRACMDGARKEGRAFHVILIASGGAPELGKRKPGDPDDVETLDVGPLPLRAAAPMLPGAKAQDVLRAYLVFGGIPRVLQALDVDVTVETNIRKLTLDPEAPFADVPAIWLERDLQTPSRYNAALSRMAQGECDWKALHEGVPDLTSSSQLAPYVNRLEELGLVEVRRSLDAAPNSRARRYRLTDPFLAFWFRFIHPLTYEAPAARSTPDAEARALRRLLDEHIQMTFSSVARQHMRFDALETLGANARELGSLWGPDYDIPVAGILTSGAAFYGDCAWRVPARGSDPLGALDRGTRETRYGFGREHRLRILFTGHAAPRWLQRAAVRADQARLMGPEDLVGEKG